MPPTRDAQSVEAGSVRAGWQWPRTTLGHWLPDLRRWPVVVGAIFLLLVFVPVPGHLCSPGDVASMLDRRLVPPLIIVASREASAVNGDYLAIGVKIDDASPLAFARGWLSNRLEAHRADWLPPGMDRTVYRDFQESWFRESILVGAVAAAQAVPRPADLTSEGVRVMAVIEGRPADGLLRPDDVIVSIDGEAVHTATEVVLLRDERAPGAVVTLGIVRGVEPLRVEVTLPENQTQGLGAVVEALDLQAQLPIEMRASEASPISGPSTGLAAMLAAYDVFAEDDIAAGRTVAATGLVDRTGKVHDVSCVRPKAATALKAGADVLLVPADQAAAARDAVPEDALRIVPVTDLGAALAALGR